MSVRSPGGPGPGGQHGEEECSAGRERLRRMAWLWQPGEVEEQHVVAREGVTYATYNQGKKKWEAFAARVGSQES